MQENKPIRGTMLITHENSINEASLLVGQAYAILYTLEGMESETDHLLSSFRNIRRSLSKEKGKRLGSRDAYEATQGITGKTMEEGQ